MARKRSLRGTVRGGMVETVYSIVVGEGWRVWRWGAVVSILGGWFLAVGSSPFEFLVNKLQPYRDKE